MIQLIMLCGISGNGKSTYAHTLGKEYKIHSSDKLREEILGDVDCQDRNNELFEELHNRVIFDLKEGRSVIYDATNINMRRRIYFLTKLKGIECERKIIYFNNSLDLCKARDFNRERKVGNTVIDKQYKSLKIPQYYEGWDSIEVVSNVEGKDLTRDYDIEDMSLEDYHELCREFELGNIIGSSQNNHHHSLSIDRHCYKVYKVIKEQSKDISLLWSALLHDIGKDFCRSTNVDTLYDSFYGHELVSAQIAFSILNNLNIETDQILEIADIIQNHMRVLNCGEKGLERLKKRVGDDRFNKIMFLHEADIKGV